VLTLACVFDYILNCLIEICDANSEIVQPNQFAAPAAAIQAFVSNASSSHIPNHLRWIAAQDADPGFSMIKRIDEDPSLLSKELLKQVNYNFHCPLHKSQIILNDGILVYHEPIACSGLYMRLILVPQELCSILFILLPLNPICGYLDAFWMLHCLRLHYYWPGMFSYVTKMCHACPGCALANPTKGKSANLVYGFPIEAPFLVLHNDAYSAGAHTGFKGSSTHLIACCSMCLSGALEPISNANAMTFASVIMKIMLRCGFAHTVVLNKDSKFFGIFCESLDLLKIHCQVLFGNNHDGMLVERLNHYLNKGLLRIMSNMHGSALIALEALLLLI
jgi:hypothetical protein